MAKKGGFAFRPMPGKAKGNPQRSMPKGQMGGLAPNHDERRDWHAPNQGALRGVKNPPAIGKMKKGSC
jgi:hypothetical protein